MKGNGHPTNNQNISERAVKKRIAVAKKRVRTMFQKEDFL